MSESRLAFFPPKRQVQPLASSTLMPPLSLIGKVTKVGAMAKTATVTVSRFVEHPRTHKVNQVLSISQHLYFYSCSIHSCSVYSRVKNILHMMLLRVRKFYLTLFAPPTESSCEVGHVELKLDDRVLIRNCPPISARKRFTLESVLGTAKRPGAPSAELSTLNPPPS